MKKTVIETLSLLAIKRDSLLQQNALNDAILEQLSTELLGRKGKVVDLMALLKDLPLEDKKIVGPLINQFKVDTAALIAKHQEQLKHAKKEQESAQQKNFDISISLYNELKGTHHIYTQIIQELEDIFIAMGYDIIDGPEIEDEYHNFQALNIPADHPAREENDSFFLEFPGMLLRTQTSSVQAKAMHNSKPPLAFFSPGRVYRREATDQTHDFLFTQAEGFFVDKHVAVSNLLATARLFLQKIFEKDNLEIRVRPGYFPFVEPGLEIDASCPFCKHGCSVCKKTGWIELLGSGMIHPNVLKAGNIDPTVYSGFAFGVGIERLIMIKHAIYDIRLLHSYKIPFLNQF